MFLISLNEAFQWQNLKQKCILRYFVLKLTAVVLKKWLLWQRFN